MKWPIALIVLALALSGCAEKAVTTAPLLTCDFVDCNADGSTWDMPENATPDYAFPEGIGFPDPLLEIDGKLAFVATTPTGTKLFQVNDDTLKTWDLPGDIRRSTLTVVSHYVVFERLIEKSFGYLDLDSGLLVESSPFRPVGSGIAGVALFNNGTMELVYAGATIKLDSAPIMASSGFYTFSGKEVQMHNMAGQIKTIPINGTVNEVVLAGSNILVGYANVKGLSIALIDGQTHVVTPIGEGFQPRFSGNTIHFISQVEGFAPEWMVYNPGLNGVSLVAGLVESTTARTFTADGGYFASVPRADNRFVEAPNPTDYSSVIYKLKA